MLSPAGTSVTSLPLLMNTDTSSDVVLSLFTCFPPQLPPLWLICPWDSHVRGSAPQPVSRWFSCRCSRGVGWSRAARRSGLPVRSLYLQAGAAWASPWLTKIPHPCIKMLLKAVCSAAARWAGQVEAWSLPGIGFLLGVPPN